MIARRRIGPGLPKLTHFGQSIFFKAVRHFVPVFTNPPGSASSSELRPAQLVRQGSDVTAYIAGDTSSAQTTFKSYRSNGACVVGTETLEAWIAETSYPLTQHYPEPLTIHYQAGCSRGRRCNTDGRGSRLISSLAPMSSVRSWLLELRTDECDAALRAATECNSHNTTLIQRCFEWPTLQGCHHRCNKPATRVREPLSRPHPLPSIHRRYAERNGIVESSMRHRIEECLTDCINLALLHA